MTPPGGSRDGGGGGGEHDDPRLGAMRAVWREMRDEDPTDRGLADLLAAARSQAAAMQPRPGDRRRTAARPARPRRGR